LVDYELAFDIPECGAASIFWKKLCGNPLVNREGFYIDMTYKGFNTTIVKNGLVVNSSYFD
jgi:hypothetical protein